MPLYELTCAACRARYTILVGMTAAADSSACPRCGANQGQRRISRFTQSRASSTPGDDPADPASMRAWADAVQSETGERLGDDFDEFIDSAERGEEPTE